MTDKDNIKLKTDTLSSRKSGSSVGVHVKRKRKIIVKPTSAQASESSLSVKKETKKEFIKDNTPKEVKTSNASPAQGVAAADPKPAKKHKIDKDEKIVQLDLTINSIVQKKVTSKNKKGNPETFLMEIIINLKVFKDSKLISDKIFKEDFEYNNKSSQFELSKYEKNIQDNLSQILSEYIIQHLYSIK